MPPTIHNPSLHQLQGMARTCKFSIQVALAVTAIGYIYFSTVFVFVDQWFGLRSSTGIMNTFIFTAVAFFCISNYVVTVFTDPGRVPPGYMSDLEEADNGIHEIKRKALGPNILCWVCPTSSHISTGLRFPTAYDNKSSGTASR